MVRIVFAILIRGAVRIVLIRRAVVGNVLRRVVAADVSFDRHELAGIQRGARAVLHDQRAVGLQAGAVVKGCFSRHRRDVAVAERHHLAVLNEVAVAGVHVLAHRHVVIVAAFREAPIGRQPLAIAQILARPVDQNDDSVGLNPHTIVERRNAIDFAGAAVANNHHLAVLNEIPVALHVGHRRLLMHLHSAGTIAAFVRGETTADVHQGTDENRVSDTHDFESPNFYEHRYSASCIGIKQT